MNVARKRPKQRPISITVEWCEDNRRHGPPHTLSSSLSAPAPGSRVLRKHLHVARRARRFWKSAEPQRIPLIAETVVVRTLTHTHTSTDKNVDDLLSELDKKNKT